MQNWRRKECTYRCVRVWSDGRTFCYCYCSCVRCTSLLLAASYLPIHPSMHYFINHLKHAFNHLSTTKISQTWKNAHWFHWLLHWKQLKFSVPSADVCGDKISKNQGCFFVRCFSFSLCQICCRCHWIWGTLYHCTILFFTILYYTILYYTILYYTILYYTLLHFTLLYFTLHYL